MAWVFTDEGPRSYDDATRTVTTYDATGTQTGTRPYTPEEHAAADARAAQDATLTDLAARVARIEAHLWPTPPDPTGPDDPTISEWEGVWPAGGLLRDGGRVWRNVTTVPLTSRPSDFPGVPAQWGNLFVEVTMGDPDPDPDPDPPAYPQWRGEWDPDADYVPGDHVSRGGIIYRAILAHGAAYAGTWGPPSTGVWETIGPA